MAWRRKEWNPQPCPAAGSVSGFHGACQHRPMNPFPLQREKHLRPGDTGPSGSTRSTGTVPRIRVPRGRRRAPPARLTLSETEPAALMDQRGRERLLEPLPVRQGPAAPDPCRPGGWPWRAGPGPCPGAVRPRWSARAPGPRGGRAPGCGPARGPAVGLQRLRRALRHPPLPVETGPRPGPRPAAVAAGRVSAARAPDPRCAVGCRTPGAHAAVAGSPGDQPRRLGLDAS